MSNCRSIPAENGLDELNLAGADDFLGVVFAVGDVVRAVFSRDAVPPTDPNGAKEACAPFGGDGGPATSSACNEE